MPSCAVKWCGKSSTTSNYNKDGITFHRFPNDIEKKEIWINATGREVFFPAKHSVICSRHFTSDCFEQLKNRRRLFSSAVPTLCLPLLTSSSPVNNCETQSQQPPLPLDTKSQGSSVMRSPKKSKITEEEYFTPGEQKMKRQIDNLKFCLSQKKKEVKKLQDKTRTLKKKVANLAGILEELTKKSLLNKENEDI